MKVCLLNTSECRGGAAVACNRLRYALEKEGIEVKMLVRDKKTTDKRVQTVNTSFLKTKINLLRFVWERFVIWGINGFSRKNLFLTSLGNTGINVSDIPEIKEADIIHLHWVNQGFLSLKDIEALLKTGKPMIWTLHDMWAFTGICHYSGSCRHFTEKCGRCWLLRYPGKKDLSAGVWKTKNKIFSESSLTLVGCSRWMASEAHRSSLFRNKRIEAIPNPINTEDFVIKDKLKCRERWNLPQDKKLLLFGADRVDDDRKGFNYLIKALNLLVEQNPELQSQIEVIIFGRLKNDIKEVLPFQVHHIGYVTNTEDIVRMYNSADLFVIPSLEDNLPNTIMEAMACGIPVVGFNTGGIPEMIDHKVTGYVAAFQDAGDLMLGIKWVLFQADYLKLTTASRAKVMENYAEDVVAGKYIRLYSEVSKINI